VAVVRGEHHGEGFESRGVLEGFDLAEPTETAPGQLVMRRVIALLALSPFASAVFLSVPSTLNGVERER
jgi:hypothetical protein